MTMLDIVEETTTAPSDNDGDHDAFAHYVDKEDIIRATFEGVAVYALCGKKWVASKSPDGKTVCPECKDVYENVVQKG